MRKIFILFFVLFYSYLHAALIAEYRFDACSWDGTVGEVKESSDAYNGTAIYGAFPRVGVVNNGANLTGNNYIKLENNISVQNDYTISLWVKFPLDFSSHTSYDGVYYFTIADRAGGADDFIYLRNDSDGWQWKVHDDSGYGGNTLPSLSSGWHMLTFTANNGTTTLYIDAIEENNISKHSKGELNLIGTSDYDDDEDGQTIGQYIDEFKIFDTSLSQNEIQSIYNNEQNGKNYDGTNRTFLVCSLTSIPKAEYRFDSCSWDGTTDEVKEYSNDYNGTAYEITPSNNALVNHSANLSANTTTDYISINHAALDGLNAFTISAWINTSSGDYQTIISGAHAGGTAEDANEVLLWLRDSGKIEFFLKGVRSGALTIPNIQDNKWHHIIWSREDKHVILYIDGEKRLDASYSSDDTLGALTVDAGGLIIGQDQDSVGGDLNQTFLGNIDEVKIFNTIISDSDAQILYNNDQIGRNYNGEIRDIPICSLAANYYFDSCQWSGTDGEVIDTTHNYNANILNDTNTTTGTINNAASLPNENNISNIYGIDTGLTPMDIGNEGSISFWFQSNSNWSGGEGRTLIDASKGDKYFFVSLRDSGKIQFLLEDEDDKDMQATSIESFSFLANEWVHLTLTWELPNHYNLYINGQKSTLDISLNSLTGAPFNNLDSIHIGDIILDYISNGRENSANGAIDEFKVFKYALTPLQAFSIYANESNHKNYDGSHRMAVDCTTPILLAEYRFDECKYSGTSGEVLDTQGADNNGTITGDANISKEEKKVGHALLLNGGVVDINDLAVSTDIYKKNTVMFWMYWDGTSNVVPFSWDYYCLWFYNGYFGINAKSSVIYGINNANLSDGWHHVTAIFTNKDMLSNQLYIDGALQTISLKQGTIANDSTSIVSSNAYIGAWSDHNYQFKSYLDELKIYKGEVNATTIASIYNSEKDLVRTITCAQAILNAVNQNGGCFNWDNNITTKIADKPIDLTILSRDKETNSTLSDVNITRLELLSFSDVACNTLYETTTLWEGNATVDSEGCFNPASFTHNKAVKCAKVRITALYEGENIESNSSDTFAIRPEKFILTPTLDGKLTAEHSYSFHVEADNYQSNTPTADFNQTLPTPTSSLRFREGSPNDGSLEGTFNFLPSDLNFSNGLTSEGSIQFNNVGIVTLEINDTTWAEVDSDDTPLAERRIYLEQNLTFIPDHFDITFTSPIMTNFLNGTFTYLSNDLNMSAWLKNLSITISAKGEQGGLMTNYATPQSLFYANDLNITTTLTVLNNPIMIAPPSSENGVHLSFLRGVADLNYSDVAFNYPRDYKSPSEPIMITGNDANLSMTVQDSIDTAVNGENSTLFAGAATFYFGKIVTEDVKTKEDLLSTQSFIQIYSSTNLSGFAQITSHWYINKDDNISTLKAITAKEKRTFSSDTSSFTQAQNILNANKGKITYDLINSHDKTYKAFYHLDIPNWLWYSRYSDYNASSSCADHPCFTYIYESENANETGIKSGTYQGSTFATDLNTSIKRKAIKILR